MSVGGREKCASGSSGNGSGSDNDKGILHGAWHISGSVFMGSVVFPSAFSAKRRFFIFLFVFSVVVVVVVADVYVAIRSTDGLGSNVLGELLCMYRKAQLLLLV